eukprot:560358-Prymnesium_polylepis.1
MTLASLSRYARGYINRSGRPVRHDRCATLLREVRARGALLRAAAQNGELRSQGDILYRYNRPSHSGPNR